MNAIWIIKAGVSKLSDHYYSKKPHSELKTEKIQSTLRNESFIFTTSSGVFSKRNIDYGTRQLIETFEEPLIDGPFLDLGCGYGPIGIALARTFKNRSLLMVDINERAISLAKENIIQNGIKNAEVVLSDGFLNVTESSFAAIITNPPIRVGKKIVYSLLEESFAYLRNRGELWVVVQKKQGAPSLISFLRTLFPEVEIKNRRKGYYVIQAIKSQN